MDAFIRKDTDGSYVLDYDALDLAGRANFVYAIQLWAADIDLVIPCGIQDRDSIILTESKQQVYTILDNLYAPDGDHPVIDPDTRDFMVDLLFKALLARDEAQRAAPLPSYKERVDNALEMLKSVVGVDGSHHKQWGIVQAIRLLCGTDEAYQQFIHEYMDGENGPDTYGWDEGIEP